MLKVNAKTKLFGVLADPIEHVRAPDIYNERWICLLYTSDAADE